MISRWSNSCIHLHFSFSEDPLITAVKGIRIPASLFWIPTLNTNPSYTRNIIFNNSTDANTNTPYLWAEFQNLSKNSGYSECLHLLTLKKAAKCCQYERNTSSQIPLASLGIVHIKLKHHQTWVNWFILGGKGFSILISCFTSAASGSSPAVSSPF